MAWSVLLYNIFFIQNVSIAQADQHEKRSLLGLPHHEEERRGEPGGSEMLLVGRATMRHLVCQCYPTDSYRAFYSRSLQKLQAEGCQSDPKFSPFVVGVLFGVPLRHHPVPKNDSKDRRPLNFETASSAFRGASATDRRTKSRRSLESAVGGKDLAADASEAAAKPSFQPSTTDFLYCYYWLSVQGDLAPSPDSNLPSASFFETSSDPPTS